MLDCTYKAGSVLSSYRHHVLSFVWTHWHSLVLEAMLRNMFCPPAPQVVLVFPCFTTLLSSLPCEFKDINMQLTTITIIHTLLKASHDWRIGNEEDRRTAEAFPNREAINLAHQPSTHLFIDFQYHRWGKFNSTFFYGFYPRYFKLWSWTWALDPLLKILNKSDNDDDGDNDCGGDGDGDGPLHQVDL